MSKELQYDVNEKGEVINIKTVKGEPYRLTGTVMPKDFVPPKRYKPQRWAALKTAIIHQPPGVWVEYSGWPEDGKELRLAQMMLSHSDDDRFFLGYLDGKKVIATANTQKLTLHVKVE